MPYPEQHFRWTFELVSPPEALWPLVSNTDRFNRDCGYPPITVVPTPSQQAATLTNARRIRVSLMGLVIEWDELAFEWLAPQRFGVDRTYYSGPVARMVMACELTPRDDGGSSLHYDIRLTPSSLFGKIALPFTIGKKARATTERVFRHYDEIAQRGLRTSQLAQRPALAAGGVARLAAISRALVSDAAQPASLVAKLQRFLTTADDLAAARIRPYALADEWHTDRRETLKCFLHATRAGLLDFSWDLVCPHCRGAKAPRTTLGEVKATAHCDTCNVDFTAHFDQSVELTFTPNASVRAVPRIDYCIGGPQVTPHVVAQQALRPGETRALPLSLVPGRYRVRSPQLTAQHAFRVEPAAGGSSVGGAGSPSRPEFPPAKLHPPTLTGPRPCLVEERTLAENHAFLSDALVVSGGRKIPLSHAATKPSVTLFNSSQRARIVFASSLVMTLSDDDVAIVASMSANSCTMSLVIGISGWPVGRFFGLRM